MSPGWPVVLREDRIGLRPLRQRDAQVWREVRSRNASWLRRWEGWVLGQTHLPHRLS